MSSLPRRKKILLILIIVSPRLRTAFDNEEENTVWETIINQTAKIQPMMLEDDTNWTTEQNTVYREAEDLADFLEEFPPDGTGYTGETPYEEQVQNLSDALQTALDEL